MATYEIRPSDTNDNDLQLFIDNVLACTLVYIPKGSFLREDGKIVMVNAFCMARFAVTQEFYETVIGHNPSSFQGKQHPVEQVTWYDAVRFCGILNNGLKDYEPLKDSELLKLNILENTELDKFELNPSSSGFRLPTRAEWEYAAKGNAGNFNPKDIVFKYSGSDNLDLVGWYSGNNDYETKPVGLKFPNNFGLHDMSGNVLEWCWDWMEKDFNYYKGSLNNPVGEKSGVDRLFRGGFGLGNAAYCRSGFMGADSPSLRSISLGFRLVFVP